MRPPASTNSAYILSSSACRVPGCALLPSRFLRIVRTSSLNAVTGFSNLAALPNCIFAIELTNASDRSRTRLGTTNSGLNLVYRPPRNLLAAIAPFSIPCTCCLLVPLSAAANLGSVISICRGLPFSNTVRVFLSASL